MTIGERNNNPLNICRVKWQKWKGEESAAPFPPPSEGLGEAVPPPLEGTGEAGEAFCRFRSVPWGLRAAFCILRTYAVVHGAVCIRDIIRRWAPPSENDTERYIRNVCQWTGLGDMQPLTERDWPALVRAMARQECGVLLSEEIVNKGFELYKQNK